MKIKIRYKDDHKIKDHTYFCGRYTYIANSYSCKEIVLNENKKISFGSSCNEKTWDAKDGKLYLYGKENVLQTFEQKNDKKWDGFISIKDKKYPVQLQKINDNIFLENKTKFIYFACLHNTQSKERAEEYIFCLKKNLELKDLISDFYILYDMSSDSYYDDHNLVKQELSKIDDKNLHVEYIYERPAYKDIIKIANKKQGGKIIIANADIHFDNTLSLLSNYNFENKALAITRHEEGNHFYNEGYSDAWLFALPIRDFYCNYLVGTQTCEVAFMHKAWKEGRYSPFNPGKSIHIHHKHSSGVRNTPWMGYGPHLRVMAQTL